MTLILSVIKSPASVSNEETQKVFTEQGGSIGRGSSNDFVLADPDRFLSSNHCSISFSANRYYLTDTSTNGTFLNGSPEPVGKGVTVMLAHSDTIEVGDYQFRVDVDDAGLGQSSADTGDLGASAGRSPLDPFAAPISESESFGVPFTSSPSSTPRPDVPLDNIDAALEGLDGEFTAVDPFGSDPFGGLGETSDLSAKPSTSDGLDPLAALDGVDLSAEPVGGLSSRDDFLGLGSGLDLPADESSQGLSHSDGAGALQQSVAWPEPKGANVIPDDWDLPEADPQASLSGAGVGPKYNNSSESFEGAEGFGHQGPPGTSGHSSEGPGHGLADAEVPRVPRATKTEGGLDPLDALLQERSAEPTSDPFARNSQSARPQPHLEVEPSREAPVTPPRPTSRASAEGSSDQRQDPNGSVLLSAMGIDVSHLSRSEVNEIEQSVGELMPVIVGGMMQVLRSRTSIKNEFRMNVTTIQPVENNPLKFSADTSDAIDNMFLRKSGAYKKPVQAFQEGFDGIGEHQVAIIAGIRAAFEAMMNRFNPSQLEKQFDKYNKGVTLPGMQKAKYWNGYIDHYRGLVDNMENSFQYLFGDEFVQAYEDQLRILVAERERK